ncbi:hypothetical protein FB565_002456 [Actinoplanes lutulentus]|uniref:Uncharacterized protein n=1 Tax=Actinoplanes lutulentus TaxID=1287878 RepID=A0A327ZF26_9ACTN|nr:hypothetical protein [Actinoplanes lutulentus]MBB2942743.1 hypothetical protein [Actinoplanes lutulentus]RAK38324.1 hypothetical protein B0I29_105272 [Actinoplanes lutulentus]
MADEEQHEPTTSGGLYASAVADTPERRSLRRKQAVVGVVGAAAVLAGAGFLALQLTSSDQPTLPEPAALAPQTEETTEPPTPEPSVTRTPKKTTKPAAEAVEISPVPSPSDSVSAAEAAASAAAEAQLNAAGAELDPVSERTELLENGTIRIVSAPRDLSGERDLSLAADRGRPAGQGVKCTTKVRVSGGAAASARPTMLLCWRTSEARSVVTMAVVPSGEPPTSSSVEIIGKEWARLG